MTTEPQPTLSSPLTRLWRHLTKRRQRQLGLLLILMLASAVSEVISLGAVLPFIGILTAPDRLLNQKLVNGISEASVHLDCGAPYNPPKNNMAYFELVVQIIV